MIKIAINGKARTGKNTLCSLLINQFDYKAFEVHTAAFADNIKEIVLMMLPEAKHNCLYGPSELRSEVIDDKYKDLNGKSLTHRQVLLDIGKLGRAYNNDIWVNCLVENINKQKDIKLSILPDLRFINEFSYCKKAGFYMIRIKRDDFFEIDDVSEKEQDQIKDSEFDKIILNNSSIDDLSVQAKAIVKAILSNNSNDH